MMRGSHCLTLDSLEKKLLQVGLLQCRVSAAALRRGANRAEMTVPQRLWSCSGPAELFELSQGGLGTSN